MSLLKQDVDKKLVRVWDVNLKAGKKVKVATIEQGPRKPSPCDGCPAPCCQGMFRPILNSEELSTKKFPTMLIDAPDWLKKKVPRAEKVDESGDPELIITWADGDKNYNNVWYSRASLSYS